MKDTRIVKDLAVFELQGILKDIPKTYFLEACKQANINCKAEWNQDLHEFGEKVTGLDTSTARSKQHIRGVYEYADGQHERSLLLGRTFVIKAVEVLVIAVLVYFGVKLS